MIIDEVIFIYEEDHKQYFLYRSNRNKYSIFINSNNLNYTAHPIVDAKYRIVNKNRLEYQMRIFGYKETYKATEKNIKSTFWSHLSNYMKCYKHIKEEDVMSIILQHT